MKLYKKKLILKIILNKNKSQSKKQGSNLTNKKNIKGDEMEKNNQI